MKDCAALHLPLLSKTDPMADGVLPYSQNGTRFEIPNGIVLEPRRKMLPRCFPASPDTIGSYIAAILQLGSSA